MSSYAIGRSSARLCAARDGLPMQDRAGYALVFTAMLKLLPLLILGVAGSVLGYIAMHAPQPDYVAPTLKEIEAHVPAPASITGEIPPGFLVRTFKVEGMCCTNCTGKIYQRLKESPGVVEAAVSFDKGIAQAVVPKDADVAKLEDAMHFEKYVARVQP